MPKKPNPRRIKRHRIYTPHEAGEALEVHSQTVLRWISSGDVAADTTKRPWLIEGAHLKAFLEARRKTGKCPLRSEQFYCLPCRAPRIPDGRMVDFQLTSATAGMLIGLCPDCGRLMHKRARRTDVEAIRAHLDVTIRKAEPRLVGSAPPSQSVNLNGEGATHAKTHIG